MKIITEGKNIALVAYAPFVGFFLAFFLNQEKKYAFATWHIKNMFGLFLLFLTATIIQSQIDALVGDIMWLIVFIIYLVCFAMAATNRTFGIPVLSEKFQQWFTFLN